MSITADNVMPAPASDWPRLVFVAAVSLALLYGAFYLYQVSQPVFGAILLALATGFAIIFGANRFYGGRFIFPGVAAVLIFIAFPVIYTIYIGFTNYSSFNLLTYERTIEVLTERGSVDPNTEQPFAVAPDRDGYRIWLPDSGLLSDVVPLDGAGAADLKPASEPATLLERRDAIKLRSGLQALTLTTPDGQVIQNAGLRTFATVTPDYTQTGTDTLTRFDGTVITANHDTGFFETADGEQVPPGWRVNIGAANFERIATSEGIREPMVSIFIWTFVFATLSVVLTFAVGLTLAVILQWEHLRFKALYRVLLILPYAVPAFISILVFKGLFNQNNGEINLILNGLFGIEPKWFTDGNLARSMLLIVNTWLGYPYMMLLAMGFLQAVPADHKKAAALEGASSVRVFFTITLPQIIPPFLPLLIASFAFNFNNMVLVFLQAVPADHKKAAAVEGASSVRVFFTITLPQIIPPFLPLLIASFAFNFNNMVLVFLLTRGLPDIPGTVIPAGETDILASFTYRLAFDNAGQQFGLAGAITLLIFIVVAAISYANFVAMRRAAQRRSGRA